MAHQLILNSTSLDELKAKIESLPEEKKIQESTSITPTASTQIVTPDSGYDGIAQINVTGDANLVPANIAEGISIFGVEGTHAGGSSTDNTEACEVNLSIEYIQNKSSTTYICVYQNSDGSMGVKDFNSPGSTGAIIEGNHTWKLSLKKESLIIFRYLSVMAVYNCTGGVSDTTYDEDVFNIFRVTGDGSLTITVYDGGGSSD